MLRSRMLLDLNKARNPTLLRMVGLKPNMTFAPRLIMSRFNQQTRPLIMLSKPQYNSTKSLPVMINTNNQFIKNRHEAISKRLYSSKRFTEKFERIMDFMESDKIHVAGIPVVFGIGALSMMMLPFDITDSYFLNGFILCVITLFWQQMIIMIFLAMGVCAVGTIIAYARKFIYKNDE